MEASTSTASYSGPARAVSRPDSAAAAATYIFIHCGNADRKARTIDRFPAPPENVAIIREFDVSVLTPSVLKDTTRLGQLPEDSPRKEVYQAALSSIHVSQVSNALKHFTSLSKFANSPGAPDDVCVVLEDDVLFDSQTLMEQLEEPLRALKRASKQKMLLYLGFPLIQQSTTRGMISRENAFGPTAIVPHCDSYACTRETAAVLAKGMLPVIMPAPAQINFAADVGGVDVYLSVPPVFADGSKVGTFVSLINANNVLVFNKEFRKGLELVVTRGVEISDPRLEASLKEIGALTEVSVDCACMHARLLAKSGRFEQAISAFENVLKRYDAAGSPVGHSSQWFREYLRAYRGVQDRWVPPAAVAEPVSVEV